MKALVWHGTTDIRCDSVPDPRIEHVRDAIIKVTSCAICGSDLHLYDHFMPGMKSGDVMGHETMGEVVDVGPAARKSLKVGDRVIIPFTIICGECEQCRRGNFSVCEIRPHHCGIIWLHPCDRRLSQRSGGISAGPLCGYHAHQSAGRHPRRKAAVSFRHIPDRLAGSGSMRHPADRHCRDLGLRPRRSNDDQERGAARCQALSRSIAFRNAFQWPKREAPSRSTLKRKVSSRD
jgi:hypothetical protein